MIIFALVFLTFHSLEETSADEVTAVIASALEEAKAKTALPCIGQFELLTPSLHSSIEIFVSQTKGVVVRTSGTFQSLSPVMPFSMEHDRLVISDEKEQRVDIIDRSMIIVTCRSYVFLVPEGNMHGFCIDAKADLERCCKLYLSRVNSNPSNPTIRNAGDIELRIPSDFEIFKDLPPLSASILRLNRELETGKILAELDKGENSKLRVGMRLNFLNDIPFEIIKTDAEYSTARSIYALGRPFDRSTELKVGARLETVTKLAQE